MPLSPGDDAPDFELPRAPGEPPVRLSDHRGRPVVLLFFPLAFSSVCTEEVCTMAERYDRYLELGAEVIGISVDSPFVPRSFAEECGADFPILSDFNREAVDAYGIRNDDFFGLEGVADRSAFVVDGDGTIVYAWSSEDASLLPDFEAIRGAVEGASS